MAEEFRLGRSTITKRLTDIGIEPESDGCYSGIQVRQLLEKGSGINRARLLKMEAETALAIAKTAVIEKEYLKRSELEMALLNSYGHVRRIIERSNMPERDKVSIYRLLGAAPEALLRDAPTIEKPSTATNGKRPVRRGYKAKSMGC
jgi:hypothetical protein